MGEQNVTLHHDQAALRRFTRELIQDVRALEYMIEEDMFERDICRIGAEQELFLVDERWQPAPVAEEVLRRNDDPRLVNELTRFNLEFNLSPHVYGGDCLRKVEHEIEEMLVYLRGLLEPLDARVVLTGILPTIHLSDLTLDNMTPKPRYFALNDAISRLRGGPAQFQIRGTDELFVRHEGILVEGCNTSFQTHFQVAPHEFAHVYNIAQVVAGPVLAAATNSPLLFGKRLWRETRIAVFQQAVDTRSSNLYLREMYPRVHFGSDWVQESVTELFKEDIARFRVLMTTGEDVEDPFEVLEAGGIPKLKALQLHNSTVYRWNRACYGITDGKPHLRVENRILPSGPTPYDEVANAAFWYGLVSGLRRRYDDIRQVIDFDDAQGNFIAAARLGLNATLVWLHGRRVSAPELIREELVPLAREGLESAGIDADDIDRYLGLIDARVAARQTGADWQMASLTRMKKHGSRAERLCALVAASYQRLLENRPGHEWALADISEGAVERMHGSRVEHHMTTDLFTVNEEELVELVACLMDWRRIRHVLVEDNQHQLCGIVTHRSLLRYLARRGGDIDDGSLSVREIMIRNPISVTPETSTLEAIRLMRERRIGALPVVRDGQLVGIITESDFVHIAGEILDRSLKADEAAPDAGPDAETTERPPAA